MCDFTLGRRSGFTLGYSRPTHSDRLRLHLDPEIEREIARILDETNRLRLRRLILTPDWSSFSPGLSPLDLMLRQPPTPPAPPLVPRGEGPETPRAGSGGDIMAGLWEVPAVQLAAGRLMDETSRRAERGWNSMATGERALLIVAGATLAGGTLAGIYSTEDGRNMLKLIEDKDIPVPGVEGFSFRLMPRGAGVTVPIPGVPGATVGGHVSAGEGGAGPDYEMRLQFDLMKFLRSR